MAGWKIEKFLGLRPRYDDRLLEANQASEANNMRLGSGNLRPLRGQTQDTVLAKTGTMTSIFPMDVGEDPVTRYWLHWAEDVDVVSSPVANDANDRHYFTGADDVAPQTGQAPKMTFDTLVDDPGLGLGAGEFPRNWRYLGIPAPTTKVVAPGTTALTNEITLDGTTVTAFNSPDVHLIFDSPYFTDRNNYSDQLFTDTGPQEVKSGFATGQEFLVTVIDADTFTLTGINQIYTTLVPLDNNKWYAEQLSTSAKQFLNGRVRHMQFTITTATDHGLRTGDIVRVRAVTSDWQAASTNTFNNVSGSQIAPTTTDINFTPGGTNQVSGNVEFDVVRDESDIGNTVIDRSYIYTFVSDLGEEGPPSEPSDLITTVESDDIVLSGFDIPPTDQRNITEIRLYRTNVSDATSDFQFAGKTTDAAAIAAGTATITDSLLSWELGEVNESTTWFPPDPNMKGLISLPNGVLAGFFGRTLAFSEPYLPHAWPPEYELQTDYKIVGLGVFGNSVLVCTTGTPYVASGAHPRQMNLRRIEVNQACVSKRSIANIGEIVLYATPDGLAAAGSDGFRIISEEFYGRDEWQALVPATMDGEVHDGKYVAFFNDGTARGLQFDPTRLEVGLTYMDDWGEGMHIDLLTDTLYLTDGSNVLSWDTDDAALQTMNWKSAELRVPYPTNYGWGRVQVVTYPVTFRLYTVANDKESGATVETLRHERTVSNDCAFRLPGGFLASRFKVEIEGTAEVQTVYLGEDITDVVEE